MIENTSSMDEKSSVIKTAIGPLDMTEVVDGYGEKEGGATKAISVEDEDVNGKTRNDGAARGGVVNDGAARGGVVNDGAARGGVVNGGTARGGVVNGGVDGGGVTNDDIARGGVVNDSTVKGGVVNGGVDGGEFCGGQMGEEELGEAEKAEKAEKAGLSLENFPFPMSVYGTEIELSMEEAAKAIERGLAFDRVEVELFAAKNDDRLLMLEEIAKDTGKSSAQLLAKLHGDCLMESLEQEYGELDNVPHEKLAEAVSKLSHLEKLGTNLPFKEKQSEMREQISEFHRQNPELTEIPEVVFEGVKSGVPLYKAYDLYRINELENKVNELTRDITISKQKRVAEQIEVPSLLGDGSSYSTGEEDVYAFFKKMW